MKLRTRGPSETPARPRPARRTERDDEDDDGDVVEEMVAAPAPTPGRRQLPRRSVAPRAPLEPLPARARPRAAPKGGVQKRKVVRPTARSRAAPAPASAPAAIRVRPARRTRAQPQPDVKEGREEDVVQVEAQEKSSTTIDDIPEEVMLGIFSYFRPPQLCWKIGRVCQRWASWSVSPFLWKGKEYIMSPDPKLSSKQID